MSPTFPKKERDKPLSPLEKQILQLVADGTTTGNAATNLRTSRQYVKNCLFSIRQKLGADTTAQAVAMALRRGLIQ